VEVGLSPGTGKLRASGRIDASAKTCVGRVFGYLQGHKAVLGVASTFDTTDLHLELIDLLGNRVEMDAGTAFLVAMVSALRKVPATAGLVILGDLSIQGQIKAVHTMAEPLQIAMENGARRALIPLENKRNFLEVSGQIVERVDPVFYSDPQAACAKAIT
jgi:ATP-dependent Lon protease